MERSRRDRVCISWTARSVKILTGLRKSSHFQVVRAPLICSADIVDGVIKIEAIDVFRSKRGGASNCDLAARRY
jgi:hypothetical protein